MKRRQTGDEDDELDPAESVRIVSLTLAELARRAPALRAAGIRHVEIGDIKFDVDPPEPVPLSKEELAARARAAADPLQDPAMYNRIDSVPGLRRHSEYDDG